MIYVHLIKSPPRLKLSVTNVLKIWNKHPPWLLSNIDFTSFLFLGISFPKIEVRSTTHELEVVAIEALIWGKTSGWGNKPSKRASHQLVNSSKLNFNFSEIEIRVSKTGRRIEIRVVLTQLFHNAFKIFSFFSPPLNKTMFSRMGLKRLWFLAYLRDINYLLINE